MRILFVGAVDFSLHCLREVLACDGNVVGVVTLDPGKSARHADYADLAGEAAAHGIEVIRTTHINHADTVEAMRATHPDVVFVFGWSQIVGEAVLGLAPLGCVGTHPALLPRNRGRHPLIWALVEGLAESGLTFFYLDHGADSGDILWQKPFSIGVDDDAATLYAKIKQLAAEGIRSFLPALEAGTAPRIPQDHSLATYWRKRGESDGEIDWSKGSWCAFNLVRALTHPYVGAHTWWEGRKVQVWRSRLMVEGTWGRKVELPGTVLGSNDVGIIVCTGDGCLCLTEVRDQGGELLQVPTGARLGRIDP